MNPKDIKFNYYEKSNKNKTTDNSCIAPKKVKFFVRSFCNLGVCLLAGKTWVI